MRLLLLSLFLFVGCATTSATTNDGAASGDAKPKADAPAKAADKTAEAPKKLFDRLGGKGAIEAVIDDFLGRVAGDELINAGFAVGHVPRLRQRLVELVCAASGGPCTYSGRDMGSVHAGMKITMSLSTTFGCPFEGRVSEDVVVRFVEKFRDLGFDGISLADTTGMANPFQVRMLAQRVLHRFPPPDDTYYTLHFHNTRGMGLANVVAGIDAGVRSFDGSIAGLGGCPFAPGATGNICTEDMVNMLIDMGYDTGVDLDKLLDAARRVPGIVGHDVPGQVMKAGKSLELHKIPENLET